jgi:hypothetical protein
MLTIILKYHSHLVTLIPCHRVNLFVSLLGSKRYYPGTPSSTPPSGGGGRFKGFPPNSRPPGGPFRGGAQGGNPSDKAPAPYQGPKPARSHSGASSSLLHKKKGPTCEYTKPVAERMPNAAGNAEAVKTLTCGLITPKITYSSPAGTRANDKEINSSDKKSQRKSTRTASTKEKAETSKRETNTSVHEQTNARRTNMPKSPANDSPSSTAGTTSTATSLPTSDNSDSINTGGTVVPPVLLGEDNPYTTGTLGGSQLTLQDPDFSAAQATKLLRSFKDENLHDKLDAAINGYTAEVAKNGTFKKGDKILAEGIMVYLNEGTEREQLLKKLGFLERERLLVHDGSASEKLDPSFYSLIPKDFSKGQYADLPSKELLQYKFGMIKEPDKASINTVLLAPHHKHIGLFGKLPDDDHQVLMGYLTSHNTKRTFEISETQPLGGQNKAQYLYVLDNAIITNNNDIESMPYPDNQDILNKYAVKHSEDILFALKDRTLARPHSAAFFDTREGINMRELDGGIFNHINEEQAKAFNLVEEYLKFKCEAQRADFTESIDRKHHTPLVMSLFWDILQYGKISDFIKKD